MSTDCIFNRRSVRRYTADPVSETDLTTLLKAGMAAPSAMNKKPWQFIVVQDAERRKSLSEICKYWGPAAQAPLVIVVCADTTGHDEVVEKYYVQDCSCASENILCTAAGLNLGGVWLGVYGEEDRMLGVMRLLGIPEEIYPVSVLAIGHPESYPEPHDSYDEYCVHHEIY